ncbi:RNA polymerase II elongator complex, subunit ELP3/histone acetyltransferase, partial [Pseudoloma neurophilia]
KDMTISNMFENQNKSGLDSQIKDMTISNMFENQNKSSLDTQMKDMSVSNLKSDQNSQNIHKNWRDLLKNAPPLDITKNTAHPEIINENASIIRELHVYGDALTVSKTDDNFYQHKGYGKKLIEYAENIAKNEHKSKKLAIISGIGTRNYYKKFGYELDGVYMSKFLL